MEQRIIFLCGINTSSRVLYNWKKVLQEEFPHYEHVFLGDKYYKFSEINKMKTLVNETIEILKDNKETYIVAHSFGGILVGSILNNSSNHNITKILTFGSPHKMLKYGVEEKKRELSYSYDAFKKINTITLGGHFDLLVRKSFTSLPYSIHKNFFVEHQFFFFGSKRFIRKCVKLLKN